MEKKHWWLANRKLVHKSLREARSMIATQDRSAVAAAVGILDTALAVSPRHEAALELKAQSLLFLRRFREVAEMLQDYIPSYRVSFSAAADDSSTTLSSSGSGRVASDSCEGSKLLPTCEDGDLGFRCFSISDLKRKVIAGFYRAYDREGQWRYLILGQACCHLGLLEDAMVLLQTGRRYASAAFRRESVSRSEDMFAFSTDIPSFSGIGSNGGASRTQQPSPPASESDSAAHLLAHIKLLLRRRAAATAALDAGHPNEAARHFSKILEGRRGTPRPFAAECLVGRAAAYRDAGRVAEAIADCNRALALEPTSIPALRIRASLLESVSCLTDCLRDLDHLKLLYESIARERKLPGPLWRLRSNVDVRYRDIPSNLRALAVRIQRIRQRFSAGEVNQVDNYKLIGVRRDCTRSELERAHLLITLRHKPEKAGAFVDRLDFSDENLDIDAVRDQARMSALILYRLLQKGYSCIMTAVKEEEMAAKKRALPAPASFKDQRSSVQAQMPEKNLPPPPPPPLLMGVFCRDMATVVSMLTRAIPVKYEALSC